MPTKPQKKKGNLDCILNVSSIFKQQRKQRGGEWRMRDSLKRRDREAFSSASLTHFDFYNYETETSKCFKCELELFRRRKKNKLTNKSIL